MKNILLVLGFLLIFPVTAGWATPPVTIALSYDLNKGSLHVEAEHPSFNVTVSYVRMMVVSLNGQAVSTLYYHIQNTPDKFWDDVPLKAQVGDVISVELFCTLGGTKSQELTVAQPDQNPDPVTQDTTN